jgi:quercetin dioxygenase-like cupin family protein
MNIAIRRTVGFFSAAVVIGLMPHGTSPAWAQQSEQRPARTVLQKLDVGITGREASLVVVEFAPGASEVPHTHPGEYIAYVLDGAFEFEVAGKPKATYRTGDSFFVEDGRVHLGRNVAQGPTKLLITFILEKGKPASSPAK